MLVLVTRPPQDARRFARQLEAAGHEALISPVIKIAYTGAVIADGMFDALIATSANAFACLQDKDVARLQSLPLYAVGERSAAVAAARGFSRIALCAASAASLAEGLLERLAAPSRLLYLAGQDRKSDLEDRLLAAGHEMAVAELYRAIPAEGLDKAAELAVREGRIDATVHFSRRSAQIFARLVELAGIANQASKLWHVCQSADVAAGLRSIAPIRVSIAARPDGRAMLELLAGGRPGED